MRSSDYLDRGTAGARPGRWDPGENNKAVTRERGGVGIVSRLACGTVAGAHENGREARSGGSAVGHVEERRDVEVRLAFVDELFYVEAVGLHSAEYARIERSAIRQIVEKGKNSTAHLGLAGLGRGASVDGRDCGAAICEVLSSDGVDRLDEFCAASIVGFWLWRGLVLRAGDAGRGEQRGGKERDAGEFHGGFA